MSLKEENKTLKEEIHENNRIIRNMRDLEWRVFANLNKEIAELKEELRITKENAAKKILDLQEQIASLWVESLPA